ncbi:MAG: (d)CMP kinase [bacterium]|nr:(d)CMP kinase [bacterium]
MIIITIDGPSGVGKGTLAKNLAKHFNLKYLDTGRLYRAVGLECLETNVDPEDSQAAGKLAKNLIYETLSNPKLSDDEVAQAASRVAVHPQVREALLGFQKNFCAPPFQGKQGVVLDGRDTGTTICPQADFKFFLKADTAARAQQRFEELRSRQTRVIYRDVLEDLVRRDDRDASRCVSPLMAADDAVVLDSSHLNADQVFQKAVFIITEKTAGASC